MNEELLAASALLVQSGAWLVSVNIKLAQGLQIVTTLVFGLRYAGWFLQLSTEVCNAQAGRQVISTTLAATQRNLWAQFCLRNADSLLEQKRITILRH